MKEIRLMEKRGMKEDLSETKGLRRFLIRGETRMMQRKWPGEGCRGPQAEATGMSQAPWRNVKKRGDWGIMSKGENARESWKEDSSQTL